MENWKRWGDHRGVPEDYRREESFFSSGFAGRSNFLS